MFHPATDEICELSATDCHTKFFLCLNGQGRGTVPARGRSVFVCPRPLQPRWKWRASETPAGSNPHTTIPLFAQMRKAVNKLFFRRFYCPKRCEFHPNPLAYSFWWPVRVECTKGPTGQLDSFFPKCPSAIFPIPITRKKYRHAIGVDCFPIIVMAMAVHTSTAST